MENEYDILVVGAGHAGIEAALAGARKGLRVCIVTSNIDRMGYMSCNPSIGGLAKGHMVREIDVLGGEMGRAADLTCIQFKRLNSRKGPAVRGSRAQCDKSLYSQYMASVLRTTPGISIFGGEVKSLLMKGRRCVGAEAADGSRIFSSAVILTTGTFMNGVIHLGLSQSSGGRVGDKATTGLSEQLSALGFRVTRLKTGTPPRLHRDSIDWSRLEPQYGDEVFRPFSMRSSATLQLPQIACYLGYTNEKTHEIIRENLHQSPMFCGVIEGIGPRYCPSIEDKITRFADKTRHQTFLEPEGIDDISIYLQGISTSLPADVQESFVRTIPGLENVKILRPGYAVEYDFMEPTQILATLETREIAGLYFAGQINGTSGYEEAAAQGLVAGVNAALKILEEAPLILGRHQAYIGVLIDDLVTKGTKEPYRMMTSRAEHRLVLREDNTINRLGSISIANGLVNEKDKLKIDALCSERERLLVELKSFSVVPSESHLKILEEIGTAAVSKPFTAEELLRRDTVHLEHLAAFGIQSSNDAWLNESVEIEVKYEGYIRRQEDVIKQAAKLESYRLPLNLDFRMVRGLSREEIEKLETYRPITLGQAQRISGVNPSAIQALMVFLIGQSRANGSMQHEFEKKAGDQRAVNVAHQKLV